MTTQIVDLTDHEIELTTGGTVFGEISAAMAGASAVAAGAALVPTPATPALASFAVVTAVLSAGAAYIDSKYE